jgi:RNA polymerase sigma-70 factor (ECF subfamily)
MSGEQKRSDAGTAAKPLDGTPPETAFEQAFREHHAMVFRAACRITGNTADAEDVLQTVFLRLLRRSHLEGEVMDVERFLRKAAVNGALDVLRARASARKAPLEPAAPLASQSPASAPDRVFASAEIRAWLRDAVAGLSPQAAEIFALRYFEGKDNGEIAELAGTTPATVAVTLHRSRERLGREFRAWTGEVEHE